MRSGVVGNTGYSAISLGDRVLVLADFAILDCTEYRCEVSVLGHSLFHCRRIIRHRRAVNRCKCKCKALCASPVIDRLSGLQLSLCLGKGIADRQAVRSIFSCTISDCCGEFVCICVLADNYRHNMLAGIICDSGYMIIRLFDDIDVCARSLICDISEYCSFMSFCCCCRSAAGFRHRSISRRLRGKSKCKVLCSTPVIDFLFRFKMFSYSCEGVGDLLCIRAFVIGDSCNEMIAAIFCHCYCDFVGICVICDSRQITFRFSNCILIGTFFGVRNRSERYCRRTGRSNLLLFCAIYSLCIRRHRCTVNRFQNKLEAVSGLPCAAREILFGLDLCFCVLDIGVGHIRCGCLASNNRNIACSARRPCIACFGCVFLLYSVSTCRKITPCLLIALGKSDIERICSLVSSGQVKIVAFAVFDRDLIITLRIISIDDLLDLEGAFLQGIGEITNIINFIIVTGSWRNRI